MTLGLFVASENAEQTYKQTRFSFISIDSKTSTTPSCSGPLPTQKIKKVLVPGLFILLPLNYNFLKNVMS